MQNSNGVSLKKINVLGSLPPLRALSGYCLAFSLSMSELVQIEFISFQKIYPAFLYPGGDLREDETFPSIDCNKIKIRRRLTWYNPLTWIVDGLSCKGELLHAQWWTPFLGPVYFAIFMGCRLRRKPVIITVHNILPHEKTTANKIVSKLLFKLCDHFIVHSLSNKRQLKKCYSIPDKKISVIPHGPLDVFNYGNKNRKTVRDEFGFKPEEKVILLFGAIRPYKGIDTALTAFNEVIRRVPDARLFIAGKLWEGWERYEQIILDLNLSACIKKHLRYIPAEDVWKFYTASDLVILPYRHFDSQSGAGAAALAFQKPIIVTDTGGLPELVVDRYYVVPPNDPGSLAEKIISCINEPSRLSRMSDESEKIAQEISWHSIALKTLSVYENVMHEKRLAENRQSWDI